MVDLSSIFKQRIADIQSRIPVKLVVNTTEFSSKLHNSGGFSNFQSLLTQNINTLNPSLNTSTYTTAVLAQQPYELTNERKAVAKSALSLVGKVNYFWGGKSTAIGWDKKWGTPQTVTADGSPSSDTVRSFGLDCSGFVAWSFLNAGKDINAIGYSTYEQNAKSTRIAWSAAQVGDLAFFNDLSHVGIVAGHDADGNLLVAHCSSGKNNVTIDKAKDVGFSFISRPNLYSKGHNNTASFII